MIPEMIASAYLSLGTSGTQGHSESAHFVNEKIKHSQQELRKPEFYFSALKKVFIDLKNLVSENSQKGWDGYHAEPILIETYYRAVAFLETLPSYIMAPTVGAEPDGHITFEWYHSPHRVLSVSVSPEGELHYAALLGPNKSYGTEFFFTETPPAILDLIRRVDAS